MSDFEDFEPSGSSSEDEDTFFAGKFSGREEEGECEAEAQTKQEEEQEEPSLLSGVDKCPICLDKLNNEASMLNPCFHIFCAQCIAYWLQRTPKCPLCKRQPTSMAVDIRSSKEWKEISFDTGYCIQDTKRVRVYARGLEIQESPQPAAIHPPSVPGGGESSSINPNVPHSIFKSKTDQITPMYFQKNMTRCKSRWTEWLTRDLRTVLRVEDVQLIVEFVLSLATQLPLLSPETESQVSDFLGESTQLFLNEFLCFVRTDRDVRSFDAVAVYGSPTPNPTASTPQEETQQNMQNLKSAEKIRTIHEIFDQEYEDSGENTKSSREKRPKIATTLLPDSDKLREMVERKKEERSEDKVQILNDVLCTGAGKREKRRGKCDVVEVINCDSP